MTPAAKRPATFFGRGVQRDLIGWVLCALFVTILSQLGSFQAADHWINDWQIRLARETAQKPVVNDVVVIAFDDKFIATAAEPFALFHPHFSKLLGAMRVAKPRLVALDIALPEKPFFAVVPRNRPEYDYDRDLLQALAASVREFPVILARTVDNSGAKLRDIQATFLSVANRGAGLPAGMSASASAILCGDSDGRIRRYPEAGCTGIAGVPPLAMAMAQISGKRQPQSGLIDYSVGPRFKVIAAGEVISAYERGDVGWLKDRFMGQTILVGVVLSDEDRHDVPVALMEDEPLNLRVPGVVLHAQIYRSLTNAGLITIAKKWQVIFLIAVGALFVIGRTSLLKAIFVVSASGMLLAVSVWLFKNGTYLMTSAAIFSCWFAFIAKAIFDAAQTWRERRHLRRVFGGSVSPALMRRMESGAISPSKAGIRARICVMFCDVRGFTTLSEKLPPEKVVEILNVYFSAMTEIIHVYGGVIDKFMGDGIMALFGQPAPLRDPEKAALDAARAMLAKLAELNDSTFKQIGLNLEIGIGLNSGDAIVGFIGSKARHEFTAIGDTVNTSARLEGLSKTLGYPIICSASVASAIGNPDYLVCLGEQQIKGRAPVLTYGWDPDAAAVATSG